MAKCRGCTLGVWNMPNPCPLHVIARGVCWRVGSCDSWSQTHECCFHVFANDIVGATEDAIIDELIKGVLEEVAVDNALDTNCDDGGWAPHAVTSVASIETVKKVYVYLGSSEFCPNLSSQLSGMETAILMPALAKRLLVILGNFF